MALSADRHPQICPAKTQAQKSVGDQPDNPCFFAPSSALRDLLSFMSKKRQKLSGTNCVSLPGVTLKVLGWWHCPVCQRRASSVSVGQSESQCAGENQRRLPGVTGIYPKGYRRMQASELLDLKDPQSKKQKCGVRKVQCLNRCNLLIKRSACRLPTKARSDF